MKKTTILYEKNINNGFTQERGLALSTGPCNPRAICNRCFENGKVWHNTHRWKYNFLTLVTLQWAAISVWRQVIWVGSSGGDSAAAWQVGVRRYHNSSQLCIQRDDSSQHCPAGCYWRGHWSGVQQRWQGGLWGGGEDQVLPPQPHPRPRQTLHHHRGIVNTSYWRWRVDIFVAMWTCYQCRGGMLLDLEDICSVNPSGLSPNTQHLEY